MELTLMQGIPFLAIILVFVLVIYEKWILVGILVLITVISLIAMPVKITQRNMSVHEENKFNNIPEKVVILEASFESIHNQELNKLKQESKDEEPK